MFNPCCGSLKLKTGSLVVAIILMVLTIIMLCLSLATERQKEQPDWNYYGNIVMNILAIICCILVIIATCMENKWMLLPFLIICIIYMFTMVYLAVISFMSDFWYMGIVVLPIALLYIYAFLIVLAYFFELKNEDDD